jgi:hypothetical protein
MITVNTPFNSLRPLTTYLDTLEEVTLSPTLDKIADLELADAVLTDRSVLYPKQEFVHGEGYRTFGFESCTISDGVIALAHMALHEPGSQEYFTEHYGRYSPNLFARPTPDMATEGRRRSQSRSALIALGGKLAVSGAFIERDIEPAYGAIRDSMDAIGMQDEDFLRFGLERISQDLLEERSYIARRTSYQVPIASKEASANIKSAWNVVGRPRLRARASGWLS